MAICGGAVFPITNYGVSTVSADNSAAIATAFAAVAGTANSLSCPPGDYIYTIAVGVVSNLTMSGPATCRFVFTPPNGLANFDYFGFRFAGTYPDYPTRYAINDDFPLALIGINAASTGDRVITASSPGGFASITSGSWIAVAIGDSPKWDSSRMYVRVVATNGTSLTLDRPLEFDVNSGINANFGLYRIVPIDNVHFFGFTLKCNCPTTTSAYPFQGALVTNSTFEGLTIDPQVYSPDLLNSPLIGNSFNVVWTRNTFLAGQYGGWSYSNHGLESYNSYANLLDGVHETGQGANYITMNHNVFSNWTGHGSSPLRGLGVVHNLSFTNNTITNGTTATVGTIILTAGGNNTFANNSITQVPYGIYVSGPGGANAPINISILNNVISLGGAAAEEAVNLTAYPAISFITVLGNTLPLGGLRVTAGSDTTTFTLQCTPTPTCP